ncbi:hypothetical protein ACHQM5_006729 [Ranunculus cassubicifolius]
MANPSFLFLLLSATLLISSTTEALKEKKTNLHFYMHDLVSVPNPTVVRVAPSTPINMSNPDMIAANFGSIYVVDNPLTATHDLNSTLIGRSQGIYAAASKKDELAILMNLNFVISSGKYNGSTFTVVTRNSLFQKIREFPVVGGTGGFRMARGYCIAQTHTMTGLDAVIQYNVTLYHP